jgi:hypothetical protein
MIGYSKETTAYVTWNPKTYEIKNQQDIIFFDETTYRESEYFSQGVYNASQDKHKDHLSIPMGYMTPNMIRGDKEFELWIEAMDREIGNFRELGVFELVDRTDNDKPLCSRWVLVKKPIPGDSPPFKAP